MAVYAHFALIGQDIGLYFLLLSKVRQGADLKREEKQARDKLFGRVRRLVVKVGSAVLTRANGLNPLMLHRLSDQIADLREAGIEVVLVSSGAVAAGMRRIGLEERPKTIPEKQAAAAVGQSFLMQTWEEAFRKHEIPVAQVLLTGEDLSQRHRYLNARNTLRTLLKWGVVPIINENDTVVVEEIKFGDNDRLAALIGGLITTDLVVILSDIDGLYDSDPRTNPDASLISFVPEISEELLKAADAKPGAVGTGGMWTKVQAARRCMDSGIPMLIAPGLQREVLTRLFEQEPVGTLFWPKKPTYQGKKVWLANIPQPAGSLKLDDGAVRAMKKDGGSLLPVGIREVVGHFGVGAPVRCVSLDGEEVGLGLTNYSSSEIALIRGCRSEQIAQKIGYKHSDEVIHRDHFVLSEKVEK